MSSPITEPEADVCLLGLGMASGLVAVPLTMAGYRVVGIEKGPYWDFSKDFATTKYDEWGVYVMRKYDHPLRMFTYTIRNDDQKMALPVRRYAISQYIAPGHGVGGAAQHFGGQMGRYGPWAYATKSETDSRYGPDFLGSVAPTNDIEDWPLTYEELDPY